MNLFLTKSFTGLSDFLNKGVAGAFVFGKNLDVRKDMDSLSCGQALIDDYAVNATTPMTGLALFGVNCSDGNFYEFCRGGQIFKRDASGVRTLVYADADGDIIGAEEWVNNQGHKFIYWATLTKLHRKQIPGTSNWSDVDATVNGQTYPKTNLTAASWHTMEEMAGALYICNGNTLAFVGYDDSYTNNALQLVPGNSAKCLMEYNNYAYIGCARDDNSQRGYLFAWDMAQSLNWNAKRKQGGTPVNALIDAEYPLAQIGSGGKVKLCDVSQYAVPIKSFPGGGQVNPDGVDATDLAYFGVFGNTADEEGVSRSGIYTFGRVQHNANPVMNLEYALDCDEIGYVKFVGSELLVSYYKAGAGYGVKKVSQTLKATGVYRSTIFRAPSSQKQPTWQAIKVVMKPLPVGCSISARRRIDKKGAWMPLKLPSIQSTTYAEADAVEVIFNMVDKGKFCEIELTLTPNGNETPEVYYYETIFE